MLILMLLVSHHVKVSFLTSPLKGMRRYAITADVCAAMVDVCANSFPLKQLTSAALPERGKDARGPKVQKSHAYCPQVRVMTTVGRACGSCGPTCFCTRTAALRSAPGARAGRVGPQICLPK